MQWCIVRCGGVRQSQWVPAAATAGTTTVTAITPTSSMSTLSITIAITIAVTTVHVYGPVRKIAGCWVD